MKEIPFRWIDKYLIHLKIQEKFYLLFLLPLLALVILTLVLDSAADSLLAHLYQEEDALDERANRGRSTHQRPSGSACQ